MTSTDNLISLHNHLQSMEAALADFMLETILRFQNLIDVKMFLLIENGGIEPKRRYCGAPDFVQEYETNGLSYQSTGSYVELDNDAQVLVERPGEKRQHGGEFMNDLSMWSGDDNDPEIAPAKRAKIDEDEVLSHIPKFGSWNSKAKENEVDVDTKAVDFKTTEDNGKERSDVNHLLHPCLARLSSRSSQPSSENLSAAGFFSALPSPHVEERKLAAILATDNPYAVYEKKTLENKVWVSVLYKVGKNIALTCPHTDRSLKTDPARAYFSDQCELFLQRIPTLLVNKEDRPEVGVPENDCLRGYTVAGYIRQRILNGYKAGLYLPKLK